MTCPNCQDTDHTQIDTHADGYAANLQECGICGTLWTTDGNQTVVLHGATHQHGAKTNECPICHSIDQVQIDTHADGYARNLEECGICGALWSQGKTSAKLVHGATWN